MVNQNDNNLPRIGVIGMGPVGSIIAAHLIEAGAFVVACDVIPKRMDKIKKKGIMLQHKIEKSVKVEEVCYSVSEMQAFDLDIIIICVKTPSLVKVTKALKEIATDKMKFLVAQNGIDNEVVVGNVFGDERVMRMVVNFAGNISDQNNVHVSFFNPPNYIAGMTDHTKETVQQLVDMLNTANLASEIPDDIMDYIWEKAILNASLSAVCAITRKTMKEVMDFPKTFELVEAIIDESVRVAERERIELGNKFRRFCIRYLKNAGHHRPSMLVDLENGLHTEIDSLNGKIVEYGRKHYLPTPLNQSVTALVHLLEYTPE